MSRDDLLFREVNSATVAAYGYSREELLRMRVTDVCFPEDVARVEALLRDAPLGVLQRDTLRHRRADGSEIEVEVTAQQLVIDGQSVIFGSARDVTEARRVAHELAASEARFRALFESSPIPLYAFEVASLRFVDVNPATLRLYGYAREDFLSMQITDIRSPDAVPRLMEAIAILRDGGQNMGTWTHRTKDGVLVDVEITAQLIDLGGRRCVLASARDVTMDRRIQRALAESEQRYRTLFEASSSPMWLWEPTSLRFIDVNDAACRLYGYARDEFWR